MADCTILYARKQRLMGKVASVYHLGVLA